MFHLKLLVGLCLVLTCIFADRSIEFSGHSNQLSSEEYGGHHIKPAALFGRSAFVEPAAVGGYDFHDSDELYDVEHDFHESDEFTSRAGDSEEDRCAAPNGLGLRNLLRQVDRLLPKREMKNIIRSYAQDPEVRALRAFARDPETKRKLKIIARSQQFRTLKDYSCRVLHLNLETYHNIASNLINPSTNRADNSERRGIRGLSNALEAVLPKQQLRDLYEKLMRTDKELVKAVDRLKSNEFHQLLLNVKYLREYQDLRSQLISLGVPVDDMRNLIGKALGWSNSADVLF